MDSTKLSRIHKKSITETNLLILVGANVVEELVGYKRSKYENNNTTPW